jgi:hypothetical protein
MENKLKFSAYFGFFDILYFENFLRKFRIFALQDNILDFFRFREKTKSQRF